MAYPVDPVSAEPDTAADPWVETSPGALGRLAIHADPAAIAEDLRAWWVGVDGGPGELAAWLRAVADAVDGGP